MKVFVLLFMIIGLLFAQSEQKLEVNKTHTKEEQKKENLSPKERAYQEYLAKLEEENKQLEDDGFCSCNNN